MTGPVTLDDLIRESKLLWGYCRDCCRERDVDLATIPLPPEFPVPEVGSRMRCSACGSRAVETKPELYPGGRPHSIFIVAVGRFSIVH